MGEGILFYNEEKKEFISLDSKNRMIRKFFLGDIDDPADYSWSGNYIIYRNIAGEYVCYDWGQDKYVFKKRYDGYYMQGMDDNVLLLVNESNEGDTIFVNILDSIEYHILWDEYLDSHPLFRNQIREFGTYYYANNKVYGVVNIGDKNITQFSSHEIYVIGYDILSGKFEEHFITNKSYYIAEECFLSDKKDAFFIVISENSDINHVLELSLDFVINKQYDIRIKNIGNEDSVWVTIDTETQLVMAISTWKNEQYLAIIDRNTNEVKTVKVSEAEIYDFDVTYFDDDILCILTKYDDSNGYRSYGYLCNNQGHGKSNESLKMFDLREITHDFNDGNKKSVAGRQAENEVDYTLGFLPSTYIQIKNDNGEAICFRNKDFNDFKQEIDHVIIGEQGVFLIETKNYAGDITINSSGAWIRDKGGFQEVIENPDGQVQRHHNLINSILGIDEIFDIICVANKKGLIEGADNSRIPIVRSDCLLGYIQSYKNESGHIFSDKEREALKKKLENYMIK